MRITIEFGFVGNNFAERIRRYDMFLGCNAIGFAFRLKPIFLEVVIKK
jgi:hypothetical protein